MTTAAPPRRPIGVTAKVIAILEAFTGEPPGDGGLTLTEICWRAGLPLATGHRLVGELTAGGSWSARPTAPTGSGCGCGASPPGPRPSPGCASWPCRT
ncbi:helix-turn-helix domain-containing protein [Thermomonospora catenispora]|uniref:helix-turn-helix domain-containing protein n=1 Tax=Thermomonospora catenispora TaxID=2493090 RepID=UPI001F4F5FCB|nr:helix-turn-helix domain-containing protein [Thermomonospora catenispora]